MIRDKIVMGLQNEKLPENLQLDPALTLDKAVNEARRREALKKRGWQAENRCCAPAKNANTQET